MMILAGLWCSLAIAGTTQVSMVSNGNQTPVINDNFDVLQNGVNTLQGSYNTLGGYFSSGVLPVSHGGTGQTTTNAALTALLPNQSGHAGQFLQTDGSVYGWASVTTPGLILVNTVTLSGASTSGNISFTNTKDYLVKISISLDSLTRGLKITFSGGSTKDLNTIGGSTTLKDISSTINIFRITSNGKTFYDFVTNTATGGGYSATYRDANASTNNDTYFTIETYDSTMTGTICLYQIGT